MPFNLPVREMSWAEEDWTVGLSGRVLQKVKELQVHQERLSRENKQKQLQIDNIQTGLQKQTAKVWMQLFCLTCIVMHFWILCRILLIVLIWNLSNVLSFRPESASSKRFPIQTIFFVFLHFTPCPVWGSAWGASLRAARAPGSPRWSQGSSGQQGAPEPGTSQQTSSAMLCGGPAQCRSHTQQQTHSRGEKVRRICVNIRSQKSPNTIDYTQVIISQCII